jgi:putative redox protein
MNVTVTWNGDMRMEGAAAGGVRVMMDAHAEHGGAGAGSTPMETVLLALGGCTAMDVVSILRKMRADPESLEVRIAAERAEEHPRVFTRIHLEYLAGGATLRPEQLTRAIELSQTRYCSVSAMLRATAEVTYSWRILSGAAG